MYLLHITYYKKATKGILEVGAEAMEQDEIRCSKNRTVLRLKPGVSPYPWDN
jgi:hypothetical protein